MPKRMVVYFVKMGFYFSIESLMSSWPNYVTALAEGHPVKIYFEESQLTQSLLSEISSLDAQDDLYQFH